MQTFDLEPFVQYIADRKLVPEPHSRGSSKDRLILNSLLAVAVYIHEHQQTVIEGAANLGHVLIHCFHAARQRVHQSRIYEAGHTATEQGGGDGGPILSLIHI